MINLNYNSIAQDMLSAMGAVIQEHFNDIKEMAENELEDFAQRTAILTQKVIDGEISEVQAEAILRIRRNALETILLSIAGISVIAAEEAINAAIIVLKQALSAALPGFSIL